MKTYLTIFMIAILGMLGCQQSFGFTATSRTTGNWNSAATWSLTRTGTITTSNVSTAVTGSGTSFTTEISIGEVITRTTDALIGTVASITDDTHLTLTAPAATNNTAIPWNARRVPGASDDIIISGGVTVTVTANAACNSLTYTSNNAKTVTFGSNTVTLTIAGALSMDDSGNGTDYNLIINTGTVTAASLTMKGGGNGNGYTVVTLTSGTLTISGAVSLTPNNAPQTITVGTGTFNAGSLSLNGSSTPPSSVTASTGTINVSGNISFSGTASRAQLTFTGAGTLNLGGNFGNGGTFTKSTSTVNFNGAGTQTNDGGYSFNNMMLSNAGTIVTSSTSFGITGTLTINANTTFNPAAAAVINSGGAAGTITGSGTIKVTRIAATADYVNQYKFSTNTLSSLIVDYAGAGAQTVNSTVGNYGALKTSGGAFTKTLTGAVTVNGSITIGASTTLDVSASNYSLTLGGNWQNDGTFTQRSGAVTLNGSSAQSIGGSTSTTFNNLTISNTSAPVTINTNSSAGGTLDVNANAILSPTSGVIISGAGTLTGNGTVQVTKTGDGTNDFTAQYPITTKTLTNLTVEFAGTSAQKSTTTPYGGLKISNSSGVTLGASTTVNGTLTVNGLLIPGALLTVSGTTLTGTGTVRVTRTGGAADDFTDQYIFTNKTLTNLTVEFAGTSSQKSSTPTYGGLVISNSSGVTLGASTTIGLNLNINSGAVLTVPSTMNLTVSGTLTNSAGNSGLVIKSDATGTGSLLHNTSGVAATVERYFTGAITSWHLLSSPVASQAISTAFTLSPATSYDFYTWYEPTVTWVNFKNTTVPITWNTANGSTNFTPGKGYLVEYNETHPTKQFQGNLNNGTVSYALSKSGTGTYAAYNFPGNPYPSAIDWKASSGWTRTSLVLNGSGYDMSIWNDAAGNYGSYNSAGSSGTNGVTQFIPVGQGFMVKAASPGNLVMDNAIRVHNSQGFLKSSDEIANILRMKVTGNVNSYSDEIVIEFGHNTASGGAEKMFSFYETAPSLYTVKPTGNYSIDFRGEPGAVTIPVSFKAGIDGTYTLTASQLESFTSSTVITLEDLQAVKSQNLMQNPSYTFTATKNDGAARFQLHFGGTFGVNEKANAQPITIYASGSTVYISNVSGTMLKGEVIVYNMIGQAILHQQLSENPLTKINLNGRTGYYLVKVITSNNTYSCKAFIN